MKFFGEVRRGPRTNHLGFGGDLEHNPGTGFLDSDDNPDAGI